MIRLVDRYILRETLPLVFLSLLVFTFLLMIPPIMQVAEQLIAKGVDGWTIAKLMLMLVPQGLGVTIPMAVLIGLLMGMGRMSGDREMVAIQACGVSVFRLLRPVIFLAAMAGAATCYVLIEALPDANQAYRNIVFQEMARGADNQVKPRVFDQGFPGVTLWVNEVDIQGTGWSNVFLADTREEASPQIYVAERGHIVLDQDKRQVDIVLTSGAVHRVEQGDPATYNVNRFGETIIGLAPDTIFPDGGPQRGLTEMTIPELQAQVADLEAYNLSAHNPIMEIHQKFSIPVACLVFALIGLASGMTNRKDGKLASFALGIGVIFSYYILMFGAKALAKGALVSPHLAMWLPNIVLGGLGVMLVLWRAQSSGGTLGWPWNRPRRGQASAPPLECAPPVREAAIETTSESAATPLSAPAAQANDWSGVALFSLLDRYVAKQYLKLVSLSFVGLLGIFYISTFVDLSDKLFKGETTALRILEYFWYATPQFVYFVLPISALVATLVTVGLLTKTSELTVMKACGISLYRASFPLLFFSVLWSGVLFSMSESVLADANRKAVELRRIIRGGSPQYVDVLNRRWLMAPGGTIYHYTHFDPNNIALHDVTAYRFAESEWRMVERTFADVAQYDEGWQARDVWTREFTANRTPAAFSTSHQLEVPFTAPEQFATERPQADRMNYRELDRYIVDLSASGVDVVALRVELQRKLSFPLVTLILTLIAVPFAVTTGKHGALYGVGIGIVLALSYWVVISIFSAIGSAGLLTPLLAAWAPNVLFGGSAIYLLLAVRT